MHVDTDDLATLFQLQHVDLEALHAKKKLEALPQRKIILEMRAKKKTINQKREQLDALHAEADAKLSRIGEEDAKLADKQHKVQAEIDSVRGDYRSVESRTKELSGFAKRRAVLEGELNAVGDELAKIEGIQAQVAQALATINEHERDATTSFVTEGGALKDSMARAEAQRAMLVSSVPKELMATYETTAARAGGVAIGRLLDSSCGVCRMEITHGRLIDMKAHGNVSTCPQCGRLLILE